MSSVVAVKPSGPIQLKVGLLPFVTVKSIEPVDAPHELDVAVKARVGSSIPTLAVPSTLHAPSVTVTV